MASGKEAACFLKISGDSFLFMFLFYAVNGRLMDVFHQPPVVFSKNRFRYTVFLSSSVRGQTVKFSPGFFFCEKRDPKGVGGRKPPTINEISPAVVDRRGTRQ